MQNSGVDVLCCGSCPKKAALKWNPQKVLASCEAFLDTFPFAGAERDMDNPRHTTRKWWTYVEIVLVSAQPMKEWKDLSTQPEFVQWYCWSFACGIIILQCCEKTPSVSQDLEHRSVIVMRCDECMACMACMAKAWAWWKLCVSSWQPFACLGRWPWGRPMDQPMDQVRYSRL